MKSDFLIAVTQLAAERNLPRDMVISAVEAALVSAYKKNSGPDASDIKVVLDPNTGDVSVYRLQTVVETVENDGSELTVAQAKKLRKGSTPQIGDILEFEMEPQEAGRIEAQTAKQVVNQRLREAERELVFTEFAEREGEVFTGTVQRSEARYGGPVTLDLNGRAEALLPHEEQSPYDRYRPGVKVKVMILSVDRTSRGPEILVTRAHSDLLRRLFEMEVPEIYNGIVEIRGISREAGSRSKVAVYAKQEGVDPVGACVGLRGIRIQNIVNELQGEKIDVIQWSRDPSVFISNALSPAQPLRVELEETTMSATVVVQDRLLSLAIGRDGQNARLTAKLTGWNVDIKSSTEVEIERMKHDIEGQVAAQAAPATAAEAPAAVAEPTQTLEAAAPIERPLVAEVATAAAEAEAARPAPVGTGMSAEELLALESLDLPQQALTEEIVEEEEIVEVEEGAAGEDIWKLPAAAPGASTGIRFAEDILDPSVGRGGGGRRGRRRTTRPPARGARPPTRPNSPPPPSGGR